MRLNSDPKKLLDPINRLWSQRKDFLDEVGATFTGLAIERIEKTKSAPDGTKWQPWASSTAKARRKEGSAGTGLLLRTGSLRDSITYTIQGPKVVIKSNSRYAQYIQNGTSKMPARPFLGFGAKEQKELDSIWKRWSKQ